MSDENYYKIGGSLEYQHPTYVVRQADSELYDGLTDGEFCYVLNSRQMGKSSLRVQMMKKLKEQGFKCASIDMTRIGSHVTPAEWYAGIVSELLRGFGLTRKVNFSSWWRDRESLPPLQRLRELIEDVLLAEFSQNLVVFIDEIDSIIKIPFKEDFFAFIRACYNQRVDNPEYNRLTFCLLGVATPSDLIEDKNVSTPFNIGRAIELTGFQLHEVTPLAQGLVGKISNPQAILREVLAWTGGQPFLTQKLCKLVLSAEESIPAGGEAVWVENLVREAKLSTLVESRIIENWETQDEPEHLRTIRDRILWSDRSSQLLRLYQQILQQGEIKANDKREHMELRLSGLVVKQHGKLRVYNRIYESVFNQSWVENALLEAGLLPQAVEKSPPSQAEIQALEQAAVDALQQFESQQIEALISAMQAGQALKALVGDGCPLQDYPTVSPLYALQTILDNIYERNKFKAHSGGINGVSFRASGRRIITVGVDGKVRIWKLSGRQIVEWQSNRGSIWSMSFSPDGQLIATAGLDGTVGLWELPGLELAHWQAHQGTVRRVAFSPNGWMIATVGKDEVRLWNLSGQLLAQWNANQNKVVHVSFSPDGQRLTTAGEDGTIRLWDVSGQPIDQWTVHQDGVMDVSFSPNGTQIATAGAYGIVKLWDLSRQQLAEFSHPKFSVRKVSFSPDGQRLATAGWEGITLLWNLSGQLLAQLKGHKGLVRRVSFSPNGQYLATAGEDGTVRLWDLSEKHLPQLKGHQGWVLSVSFSSTGEYLATASDDGTVRLWDLSGNQIAEFKEHEDWPSSVSFSPTGEYLATASANGIARLWNLSGHQIAQFKGHQGRVWSVSFNPTGEYLATTSDDYTARLWNLSGHQIAQFKGHQGRVLSASFSPTGDYLATASDDGTARLWNLSGHQIAQFIGHRGRGSQSKGHQGRVLSVSFSPTGEYLATASDDGTARLWNLSGHQIAQFKGHQGRVLSVSFNPTGEYLATASSDSTAKLWRVEGLDELLARGCDWLKDYFVTHPEALEKLEVCQNKFKSIEADRNLNRADDVDGASGKAIPKGSAQIQTTPQLPPALDSTLKTQVRQLAAKTLVAVIGEMLARQGDIEKAVAAYTEAQTLDPTIEIPANVGNNLCWWGSLWGRAADVMDACETAVALEPENGMFRDSRGLARALTGDIAGAIEDFQAFVDWTDNEQKRLQRQRWIDALRAGENPFTQEEIERLLNEYNVAHPQVPAPTTVARQRLVTTASNESGEGFLGEFLVHDKLVRIYQGDITNLAVDVIVSSDDTYLNMSGGVSWRIRHVGGNEIYRETRNFIPCYLGDIAITTAGKLQAKRIFHGVVIDWLNDILPLKNVIQQVVHICLEIANQNRFESIAFPLLGTGAGRLPVKVAWDTTLRQIIRDLSNENQKVVEVIIVVYGRKIVEALKVKNYLERIEKYGWKEIL